MCVSPHPPPACATMATTMSPYRPIPPTKPYDVRSGQAGPTAEPELVGCQCRHRTCMDHSFGPDLCCENYRVLERDTWGRLRTTERCPVTWLSHQASSSKCAYPRTPGRTQGAKRRRAKRGKGARKGDATSQTNERKLVSSP